MTSISVAKSKRLRAKQRRRLGYSDATPLVTTSPTRAPPPPIIEASLVKPSGKKRKSDAPALAALLHAGAADPPSDPSWRKHLKVVTTATNAGPVKTAWDSRYPLNRVLNGAIPSGDRERADVMGFGPAMVAIKTYGMWSSIMAHLVESSFRQLVEESRRLEEDLHIARDRVTNLQSDVQKYERNKRKLEGKLSRLSREAKKSSARVNVLERELRLANDKLETVEAKLKELEAAVVPESERYQLLQVAFEQCKLECVTNFDSGFNTAISHIKALYPSIDTFGMDLEKIVVDGHLVDAPTEGEEEPQRETDQPVEDVPYRKVTRPKETL